MKKSELRQIIKEELNQFKSKGYKFYKSDLEYTIQIALDIDISKIKNLHISKDLLTFHLPSTRYDGKEIENKLNSVYKSDNIEFNFLGITSSIGPGAIYKFSISYI